MSSESSSSKDVKQEEEVQVCKTKKPKWLENFLKSTFFESCEDHQQIRRNEMNRYCINCNISACQYCMSSANHRLHKMLKIYRHVYKDVVSLGTIEKYVDCSQIQPYKCNKRLVISLNPLPHCGPLSNNGVCDICKRRLVEPELYNYCSLSCKVTAFGSKKNELDPPFLSIQSCSIVDDQRKRKEIATSVEPRRHRRKGIPCRAPFF